MADLQNPYLPEAKVIEASGYTAPLGPALRERNKMNYANSTGSLAQPGKALSKAERLKRTVRRADSVLGNMDGLTEVHPLAEDDRYTFSGLWRRILAALNHWVGDIFRQLDNDVEEHFIPAGTDATVLRAHNGRYLMNLRSSICFVISFLIVFGAAYTLVEYLLLATRASAQCTPVTNYIPVTVTETHTIYSHPSSVVPSSVDSGNIGSQSTITTSYSTLYSTSTMFNTVTVYSSSSGMLPSAQTTVTTTQVVSPVSTMPLSANDPTLPASASDTTIVLHSTATDTETFTLPPYTSTTFSFMSPTLTTTSTSTQYTTVSIENAPSSHSTYSGIGTSGWNASTPASASPTDNASLNGTDGVRTLTGTYYLGTGTLTTSTGTTLITTTITVAGTSSIVSLSTSFTFTPSASSSSNSSAAAAITATLSSASSTSTSLITSTPSQTSVASVGVSPSMASSPAVDSNATSTGALTGSSPSSLTPYGFSTGVMPVPVTPLASASIAASANSSITSAIDSTFSTSAPSSSASLNSTTAAVVVPVTSTLSAGILTTLLETTSTTIDFIGSATTTVSGYFVYNGTTTFGYVPAAVTSRGPSLSSVSATTSSPLTSSSVAGTLSGGTGSASVFTTPAVSATLTSSPSGSAASLSIPVNNSTAALSALSSVISGLTDSSSSTMSPPSVSILSTTSSPVLPTSSVESSSMGPAISSTLSASTLLTTTSVLSDPAIATSSSASVKGSTSSGQQSYSLLSTKASSTSSSSFSNPFPASSATATPTACGEHGKFTLNFDTLPNFIPSNQNGTGMNQTDITQAPPVPNPYNHLTFSDGYVYAPQPGNLPYQPVSSPHLAVFLANASGAKASSVPPGEIGDGPYESMSAFWFDAFSAFFGCDDGGSTPCTLVFTGYTYSPAAKNEIPSFTQNATVPACPGLKGCQLHQVSFPTSFRSLSGIQVQAFVDNQERMFFMDDMALGWSNNTCQAGLTRLRYQ